MKLVKQTAPQRHKGNGQPKIEGKYFTRASSLAKVLEDQGGLINWKAKMAAKGIADSDQLRALAATTPIDDYRWRDIVERACEQAGASNAADLGTSIHAATEAWDLTDERPDAPKEILADAEAYRQVCKQHGLKPLAAEVFVANDALKTAGSFDRLVEGPDGIARILDIKTIGKKKDAEQASKWTGLSWSVQIATYATAKPYDGEDGYLEWEQIGLRQPASKGLNAYVAAIPRGSGKCFLIDIDLTKGYELAELAVEVKQARRLKPATPRLPQQELTTKEG